MITNGELIVANLIVDSVCLTALLGSLIAAIRNTYNKEK